MKKLILLIPILFACAAPKEFTCTLDLTGNCKPVFVTMKKGEAKRVQKRISSNCGYVTREGSTLELYPWHIECTRTLFFKEYSYIKDKYNNQIEEQLK